MNNDFDKITKSIQSVNDMFNASAKNIGKLASDIITPSTFLHDAYYQIPEIPLIVNPMIGLAEEQLAETKKMNERIEALQNRIDDLEEKSEKARKNQWKHDLLIAFIGAFLGFVFGLIALLFN